MAASTPKDSINRFLFDMWISLCKNSTMVEKRVQQKRDKRNKKDCSLAQEQAAAFDEDRRRGFSGIGDLRQLSLPFLRN